ncbi:hypothetical protein D9757_002101 [Collybiopsis confluens]|uniref:Uncharacterized protein n=1 Tax=Collybiopsis confluens TaxID=2823264 RepID=A0A8H5FNS4_9AGAR|nr:hypothetical protein D9757_014494 [Collybiopsis confluens]KAF5392443.1 hypothetical protein D9757_002101 [Collybiopsis confluens]
MPQTPGRTRNRSSSGAFAYAPHDVSRNQHYTPLVHHASAVHQGAASTLPLRPASAAQNGTDLGMSAASRYAHNLKVLRRRDPSILRIFDQFSHVCVYHHNGERWEKKGYEGSMFLYERADYPPYGFYILNRMGMDDYIQRLWPEDNVGVHGNYLMLRTFPEWSRKRVNDIQANFGGPNPGPFDIRYKWNGENPPPPDKAISQTIGLWMFTTEAREPMIDVMLRLHSYIKQNSPYPEVYHYGPDKPPPPILMPPLPMELLIALLPPLLLPALLARPVPLTRMLPFPDLGYVNPLLYQITDSTSTTSANSKFLGAVDELTKTKNSTSGNVTPMARDPNQLSELDTLFSKLIKPSALAASDASTTVQGSLLLDVLMSNESNSQLQATTAIQDPPSSSSEVTLESLFASSVDSTVPSSHVSPKTRSKTLSQSTEDPPVLSNSTSSNSQMSIAVARPGAVPAPAKTGLALLDDIFASASSVTSSSEYSHPLSASALEDGDQPETIEIHSPRPQAPLSLASVFDTATSGSLLSPNKMSGHGLALQPMGPAIGQTPPMIFTKQVVEDLLVQGGFLTLQHKSASFPDQALDHQSILSSRKDFIGTEARKPLDLFLTQKGQNPRGGDTSGDITPRIASTHSKHNSGDLRLNPEPSLVSGIVSSIHTMTIVHPSAFDDVNDEEETILELDFSDTRALSDLQVFELKERALREQILERKVASRNASRSTTPFVTSHLDPIPAKAKISLSGTNVLGDKKQAASQVLSTEETIDFTGPTRPDTSGQTAQRLNVADIPSNQTTSSIMDTPTGKSLLSTKKKTRRGRGKQRDKERDESSSLDSYEHSGVEGTDVPPIVGLFEEIKTSGELSEQIKPSTSVETVSSEIDKSHIPGVCLKIKDCLHSALSGKSFNVANKQGLVELAVNLLQTDGTFVDNLWNAWMERVTSPSSPDTSVPLSVATPNATLVMSPNALSDKRSSCSEAMLQLPQPISKLTDIAHSDSSHSISTPSNVILPLPPADHSLIPPMVRDVASLEDERALAGASIDEEGSPHKSDVNFALEECHVIESML